MALPQSPAELEGLVYRFNNQERYDSSLWYIQHYIRQERRTPEELYYAYLFLSYTHKRLFDYHTVFIYLDSAEQWGGKAVSSAFYRGNIACQRAYALFDTRRYAEAERLMQEIAQAGYPFLDLENKAKLLMQEGYLKFLSGNYRAAEVFYTQSLGLMKEGGVSCDAPMVYGKLIEMRGRQGDTTSMRIAYDQLLHSADSCGIFKYRLYGMETLYKGYVNAGDCLRGLRLRREYEIAREQYDAQSHLAKLEAVRYELKEERQQRMIAEQRYQLQLQGVALVAMLIAMLLAVVGFYAYRLFQRRNALLEASLQQAIFTKRLFESIEQERRRIAKDLHDDVGHEVLAVKQAIGQDPETAVAMADMALQRIRAISRNLHPVMFEHLGLADSLRSLASRLETQCNLLVSIEVSYQNVLPPFAELQLYRIAQEALSNAVKHAQAPAARVALEVSEGEVHLVVQDSGRGFHVADALKNPNAFGLHTMLERAKAIGGRCYISSGPQGTIVRTILPIR
jgi:signal transduction histidine kinase